MTQRYLRRYTDRPALLYMLKTRQITLLDPRSWDDQNDSYYLSLYKQRKSLKSVLALCFTRATETYHHWRVFASGSGGVCIKFDRRALLAAFDSVEGIRVGNVKYLTLSKIRDQPQLSIRALPFLKRFPYEPEQEYRVIFESATSEHQVLNVPIPLSCIERVTLSPWIHITLSRVVKETIKGIKGCRELEVVRSTLIGNTEWKNLGDAAK
jgi:hypothetical protein